MEQLNYLLPKHLPSTIVYVRHPECTRNKDPYAHIKDGVPIKFTPLTPRGYEQREIITLFLRQFCPFDAVFGSEHIRTHEIPYALGYGRDLEVHPYLDERFRGVWHTLSRDQLENEYPHLVLSQRDDRLDFDDNPPGGGESPRDVALRHWKFLQNLRPGLRNVLFSGHGVGGLSFWMLLTNASVEEWRKHRMQKPLKNASVTVFKRWGAYYVCTLYNFAPWEGMLDARENSQSQKA